MRDAVEKRDVRGAILDATDHLLAKHGYKKMTIEALAREVGIGKGSVYLHFKSKEDIALSHVDRIVDRLLHRLANIADGKSSGEAKIAAMLRERVLFRFDSVQHYSGSLNDMLTGLRTRLLEHRERHFESEAGIFARALEQGIAEKVFDPAIDPLAAARTLMTATNSLLPYNLSTAELGKRSEIAQRVAAITSVVLKGLLIRS
jgi:AcrR family transcriptional regulator